MSATVSIGPIDQIPPGEGRKFVIAEKEIAVFRTHADEVFATQAYCPHRNGPLADGLVGGSSVVCPLHDRIFDLRTGEEIGVECAKLKTFKVSLTEAKDIMIIF
jgi:nitrite reductase [NAD(P)H] small subunit